MSHLTIITESTQGAAIVQIKGRVDSESAPELDNALTKLLAESRNRIVLYLRDVEFFSSAGLRALIKAYQAAKKTGGGLCLAAVPESIVTILRTVGMMEMLKMYPSVEAAVASFQN